MRVCMMKQALRLAVCVIGLTIMSSQAFAQSLPWEGRGFINVSFGIQINSNDTVTSTVPINVYDEAGKITATQSIDTQSPFFDLGGGFRLAGNFGIGFAYTYLSTTGDAVAVSEIPSPLVYDQPRKATSTAGDLVHREQGFHFQALWMLPVTDKFDVILGGGPTVYSLKQGTVVTPIWSEVGPPYTSVNVTLQQAETTATRIGFNVGADLSYRFTNTFGIGGLARYTTANFELEPEGGATMKVRVGGFQLAGGLRIRF
jgi:hypothetical protein